MVATDLYSKVLVDVDVEADSSHTPQAPVLKGCRYARATWSLLIGSAALALLVFKRQPEQSAGDKMVIFDDVTPESFLQSLVQMEDGSPNPRVSCTPGNLQVRLLLAASMKKVGLKPLPTSGGSFVYEIPGSKDEQFCPTGLANVMGYVEGTDLKDEFIMLDAHFDGPNMQNNGYSGPFTNLQTPNMQKKYGNDQTSDPYDDGGAVAALMALAVQFQATPPKRSVIFSFTDGEEGFSNLGIPAEGSDKSPNDWRGPSPLVTNLCKEGGFFDQACQYPVGFTHWAFNPTVDISKIKLIVGADPWGKAGITGHDFVAVMGLEATPGLQELLENLWPTSETDESLTKPLFANRHYAGGNYADPDALTKNYDSSKSPVLANSGIPFLWMAQAGFQSYHGGLNGPSVLPLMYNGLKTYAQVDMSVFPVYFTEDQTCTYDVDALLKMYSTFSQLATRLANSDELGKLSYKRPEVYDQQGGIKTKWTLQDVQNNIDGYAFLSGALSDDPAVTGIPKEVSEKLVEALTKLSRNLQEKYGDDLKNVSASDRITTALPATNNDEVAFLQQMPLIQAIVITIDFYKTKNMGKLSQFGPDPEFPKKCPSRRLVQTRRLAN